MKQKVLWAFTFVLWFLIFSTVFSLRVEQWMTPVVTECSPNYSQNSTEAKLELDCLFVDDENSPVLYQTYEGLDWNAGLRVKLVGGAGYTVLEDAIQCGALERVIQYATRDLKPGEKAEILAAQETRDDVYLMICPTGVRLRDDLSESIQILGQTETSVLATASEAPGVFMPKQAVSTMFCRQAFVMPDERAYSLVDVDNFFGALPLAAFLPGTMVFVLLLWIFAFPLLKHSNRNRRKLAISGAFSVIALCAVTLLLHFLQFPPSLLPKDSIVNIPHYFREFTEIFSSLHVFAEASIPEAQTSLSHAHSMLWLALGAVLFCVLLGAAALWIGNRFAKKSAQNLTDDEGDFSKRGRMRR